MSEATVVTHMILCDHHGCSEKAAIRDGTGYRPTPPGWHRSGLGCDLCPRHWQEKQQQLMEAQEIMRGKRGEV